MQTPRCGVVDEGRKSWFRYVLLNKGWGHLNLTYRIENYPTPGKTSLTNQDVDDIMAKAFKVNVIIHIMHRHLRYYIIIAQYQVQYQFILHRDD